MGFQVWLLGEPPQDCTTLSSGVKGSESGFRQIGAVIDHREPSLEALFWFPI